MEAKEIEQTKNEIAKLDSQLAQLQEQITALQNQKQEKISLIKPFLIEKLRVDAENLGMQLVGKKGRKKGSTAQKQAAPKPAKAKSATAKPAAKRTTAKKP